MEHQLNSLMKKNILEYSSPNIAKTFHIEHLLNNLYHNLDKLFRRLGKKIQIIISYSSVVAYVNN